MASSTDVTAFPNCDMWCAVDVCRSLRRNYFYRQGTSFTVSPEHRFISTRIHDTRSHRYISDYPCRSNSSVSPFRHNKRYSEIQHSFWGAFAKLREATVSFIVSVRPFFRLSAWNNSVPTGRIFMKFDICVIFETMSRKLISLKSDNRSGYFTWRPINIFDHISLSSS